MFKEATLSTALIVNHSQTLPSVAGRHGLFYGRHFGLSSALNYSKFTERRAAAWTMTYTHRPIELECSSTSNRNGIAISEEEPIMMRLDVWRTPTSKRFQCAGRQMGIDPISATLHYVSFLKATTTSKTKEDFRVGSCWVFIANIFVSPHQQTVLQSTTFRPGCPSHFQVSNRNRRMLLSLSSSCVRLISVKSGLPSLRSTGKYSDIVITLWQTRHGSHFLLCIMLRN